MNKKPPHLNCTNCDKAHIFQKKIHSDSHHYQVAYKLEQEIALWDPNAVLEATSDPFKTLFVARVNFYTRCHATI